jgi:hypothetical protein
MGPLFSKASMIVKSDNPMPVLAMLALSTFSTALAAFHNTSRM